MANPADAQQTASHNILVTGGAGFIGSHVACRLAQKYPNSNVCVLDKMTYCATRTNLDDVISLSNFKFFKGDICSTDTVLKIFREQNIDTVFHFAAETHVDNSFGNSLEFTRTNVFGTHVLLECARMFQDRLHRFIHVSTDEVYGQSEFEDTIPKKESDAFNPSNPYAATKCAADHLCQSYYQSWHLPIIITRSNNVYGPRQFPEKLIPKFLSLLDMDRSVPVYGNGLNKRAWIYVDDVVDAYDLIYREGTVGETYNIATTNELSNLELTHMLLEVLEKNPETHLKFVADRPGHDLRYFSDGTKLSDLGWSPATDFPTGLRKTIEWTRSHPNHWQNLVNDDVLASEAFKKSRTLSSEGVSELTSDVESQPEDRSKTN